MAGKSDNLHLQDMIDLDVEEISLVDDGANEKPFAVLKRNGEPEMPKTIKTETQPETEETVAKGLRDFAEELKHETIVSVEAQKSLELHKLDLDAYRSNVSEAVRKSGQFGVMEDNWDIHVRAVTENSVVVKNHNEGELFIASFSTDNGWDFEFENVGKAMMRWDRMPESSAVAKSNGGTQDDRDHALENLFNDTSLETLKADLAERPEGLAQACTDDELRTAKAKRFTQTRVDKLTEAHSQLGALLLELGTGSEAEPETPAEGVTKSNDTDEAAAPVLDAEAIGAIVSKAVETGLETMKKDLDRRIDGIESKVTKSEEELATAKGQIDELEGTNAPSQGDVDEEPADIVEQPTEKRVSWNSVL